MNYIRATGAKFDFIRTPDDHRNEIVINFLTTVDLGIFVSQRLQGIHFTFPTVQGSFKQFMQNPYASNIAVFNDGEKFNIPNFLEFPYTVWIKF